DKRHGAKKLDPVDREELGRQRQLGKDREGEGSSISEVMDRKHRWDAPLSRRAGGEVGRSKPGVPVMAVQNVRAPAQISAARRLRCHPAEEAKTAMVVGPIAAVQTRIGVPGAIVKAGMIDEIG